MLLVIQKAVDVLGMNRAEINTPSTDSITPWLLVIHHSRHVTPPSTFHHMPNS